TLVARLHHDLDATVEEHQRVVTDIVHGRRIGFLDLLRQNRAWIRTSRRRCQSPRRAEIIYRNVRDGRIISATTTLLATARPAQTIIITRNPNTKDLAIADRIAAEVVASTVVSSSRPASFIVFD